MTNPSVTLPDSPPAPRILIVDDEEPVLSILRDTLRCAHHEVVAMSDPLAALEELKKGEFAVVISDQRMPGMTGLELLARAREIQPDTIRILITGVLNLDTVVEAINKGEIYRFIIKPWLQEELLVTIQNAVHRHELIRQNARLHASTAEMNERLVHLSRTLGEQVKLVEVKNQELSAANQTLEQNLLHSMELCVRVMQTFYPALGDQARRALQLCHAMARILELSADECRVLESAALLHDIGLVGVPRALIRNWQDSPHTLSPAERTLIEQHPILGQEMVSFGGGVEKIGEVIRAHHERLDGKGYPDGLSGEEIPRLARLLAVAVAFASSKLAPPDAANEIKHGANTAFDVEAVRVFAKAFLVAPLSRRERHVPLAELQPGMVLARGIYSGKGILLAPEGHKLNATYIEQLQNHNQIQPITQSLLVYC